MKYHGLRGKLTLAGICGCLLLLLIFDTTFARPSVVRAQSPDAAADWEKAAGGRMSFDSASIKPSIGPGGSVGSNFMVALGNVKPPNGVLRATNFPLLSYIVFAYKLDRSDTPALRAQLPKWAEQEWFEVEARPPGSGFTRDQVRLMMQSLLADRFKLTAHFETKPGPVYELVLAKAGKFGPQMQPYPDGFPCSEEATASRGRGGDGAPSIVPTVANGRFPAYCGRMSSMNTSGPGLLREGGRNISMESIVAWIEEEGPADRPVLNRTGLSGTFDVSAEFELAGPPESNDSAQNGPPFVEALSSQLGLKLREATAPVKTLVIDHIEEPTPN